LKSPDIERGRPEQARQAAIRFVEIESSAVVPFVIIVPGFRSEPNIGRTSWMPDGRHVAFGANDEEGKAGIFVQSFEPGRDTTATRRKLVAFYPDARTESFGISPDGKNITLNVVDRSSSLFAVDGVIDTAAK
jgi:hypothetical protein